MNDNLHKYERYVNIGSETRWATNDEIKNSSTHIDIKSPKYACAGLPLLSDGKTAYVDGKDTHTIIFGATGSKKTRLFCMPMLNMFAKAGESFIATDPKGELYEKYWPADVHVIGKDILRFHTIYWPIMLMALGQPLPKKVFGHPWLLFGNDKMSKSKGNVIYADDLVELFGVDAVRFYLLSEMPYGNDGSITYENIIARYNSELANVLGNLVNRTVAMTHKYFGGTVQSPVAKDAIDDELIAQARETVKNTIAKMEEYKTSDAIAEICLPKNKKIKARSWV